MLTIAKSTSVANMAGNTNASTMPTCSLSNFFFMLPGFSSCFCLVTGINTRCMPTCLLQAPHFLGVVE